MTDHNYPYCPPFSAGNDRYKGCIHKSVLRPLPEACLRSHVRLPYNGSFDIARSVALPVLQTHRHVSIVTMRRLDSPVSDLRLRTTIRFLQCHAHFNALTVHFLIQRDIDTILAMLPKHFIAVHVRQELDVLAYSGCIGKNDARYAEAESLISGWGGWQSRSLAVARKNLKQYGSTEKLREAGKCQIDESQVCDLLGYIGVRPQIHVYVASNTADIDVFARAGYHPVTKDLLGGKVPLASTTSFARHMSFRSLVDAGVCEASAIYVAAKGNFDRAVRSRRILRGKPTITADRVLSQHGRKNSFIRYLRTHITDRLEGKGSVYEYPKAEDAHFGCLVQPEVCPTVDGNGPLDRSLGLGPRPEDELERAAGSAGLGAWDLRQQLWRGHGDALQA